MVLDSTSCSHGEQREKGFTQWQWGTADDDASLPHPLHRELMEAPVLSWEDREVGRGVSRCLVVVLRVGEKSDFQ